jgi:hypothetical protein
MNKLNTLYQTGRRSRRRGLSGAQRSAFQSSVPTADLSALAGFPEYLVQVHHRHPVRGTGNMGSGTCAILSPPSPPFVHQDVLRSSQKMCQGESAPQWRGAIVRAGVRVAGSGDLSPFVLPECVALAAIKRRCRAEQEQAGRIGASGCPPWGLTLRRLQFMFPDHRYGTACIFLDYITSFD